MICSPKKLLSEPETHPLQTLTPIPKSQQSTTPSLHQQMTNQKNTPSTLTSKEEPCVIDALGGQPHFPAAE